MKKIFFLLICSVFLNASDKRHKNESEYESYLSLYKEFQQYLGPTADHKKGEIEIVLNPEEIAQIVRLQKKRLKQKGLPKEQVHESCKVGIISEDQYWIWIRDAVVFPTGARGTYDRLVLKSVLNGVGGVAVLPILPDKRLVLNLNFRHSTRSWELEVPRGMREPDESVEVAAIRELHEETGLSVELPIFLGNMTPDTGSLSSVIPVFLGKVSKVNKSQQDFSEAILTNVAFTKEDIKKGFERGYIVIARNGEQWKVPLRDSFLSFAILQAGLKGLL